MYKTKIESGRISHRAYWGLYKVGFKNPNPTFLDSILGKIVDTLFPRTRANFMFNEWYCGYIIAPPDLLDKIGNRLDKVMEITWSGNHRIGFDTAHCNNTHTYEEAKEYMNKWIEIVKEASAPFRLYKKYKINNYVKTHVIGNIEYFDFPLVCMEADEEEKYYITYWMGNAEDKEYRLVTEISIDRWNSLVDKVINYHQIFKQAETGKVFVYVYNQHNGHLLDVYEMTYNQFMSKNGKILGDTEFDNPENYKLPVTPGRWEV